MMNSYRRNNSFSFPRPSSGRRRLLAATVLLILLVIADALTGGSVRALARSTAASVWVAGRGVREATFGRGFFKTKRSLEAENTALRQQLAAMEERGAAYNVLVSENEALRKFVSLPGMSGSVRGVTAPIVSSLRSSPYGTFSIGAGSVEGIVEGSIVLSGENFVIGRVSDVSAHTSLVSQTFAPDAAVEAFIRGIAITADGRGGGNAQARLPRQTDVIVGDPVTSPLFAGRSVGIVGKVEVDPGGAFTDVYIRLPVNLSNMRFVYVIAP